MISRANTKNCNMERTELKKTVSDWIRSQYASSEESLRRTFRFNDVYDLLVDGIAHFWFRKRDGSLRSAYGTLVMAIIERHGGVPEGDGNQERPVNGTVPYFDLEKDAWRCFKADSVQEVDFSYGVDLQVNCSSSLCRRWQR